MFGVALGGTNAHFKVDDAVVTAVENAAEQSVRAVKVTVDAKAERLACDSTVPEGASIEEDFAAVAASLDDSTPCLVLLRLDAKVWAIVAWTPENSPVKLRMLCASSRKTLRDQFKDIMFKEYNTTDISEVTYAKFHEATREANESDRSAAMTQHEKDVERMRNEMSNEQRSAPKMLHGMAALQVKVEESFDEAVRRTLAEENLAAMGRLTGSGETVAGEVLEGISSISAIRGKLSDEQPCYIICRGEGGRLAFLSWHPELAPVKLRMKSSTFKASVVDKVKELAGDGVEVLTSEVTMEEELTDELGKPQAHSSPVKSAPRHPGVGLPGIAGGVALPGMGGARPPPPGAVAMPGMVPPRPVSPRPQGGAQEVAAEAARRKEEEAQKDAELQARLQQERLEAEAKVKEMEEAKEKARKEAEEQAIKREEELRQQMEAQARKKREEIEEAEKKRLEAEAANKRKQDSEDAAKRKREAEEAAQKEREDEKARKLAAEAENLPEGFFRLEDLQDPKFCSANGVDAKARETYLTDLTFAHHFGMDKEAFAKLPKWKQEQQKKKLQLF